MCGNTEDRETVISSLKGVVIRKVVIIINIITKIEEPGLQPLRIEAEDAVVTEEVTVDADEVADEGVAEVVLIILVVITDRRVVHLMVAEENLKRLEYATIVINRVISHAIVIRNHPRAKETRVRATVEEAVIETIIAVKATVTEVMVTVTEVEKARGQLK